MPELKKQITSRNNNPFISNTEDSNDSERELRIVEDVASEVSSENGLIPATFEKQHTSDSEINDLASVSSVIDTANSQDISKFLNPVSFSKVHSAKSELSTLSHVSKISNCKNSRDNKKFPCNHCNKSFDTSSAIKRHMVIHTGIKKHKCSICAKLFGTKSNCKRHELTHLAKSGQKVRDASIESQNTSDISNNYVDFSNFSVTTDQTGSHNYIDELNQNSLDQSFGTKRINSTSNILTNYSHLSSGGYCSTQNLECKYCLNSYKNVKDLSNHIKELHPSECRNDVHSFF